MKTPNDTPRDLPDINSQPDSVAPSIDEMAAQTPSPSPTDASSVLRRPVAMKQHSKNSAKDTLEILRRVRSYPITELPAWKARFADLTKKTRLFEVEPADATFLPDEDGRFRGVAQVTVHRPVELSSGRATLAAETLLATMEGRVDASGVTFDKVDLGNL